MLEIQQQLGVTPRGSIKAQNVREVRAAFAAFAAANPHPDSEPQPLTLSRTLTRTLTLALTLDQVRLYKDQQATRLGIIFHQSTPAELGDVSSDATPRAAGRQPVVLPVIKVRVRVRVRLG